MPRAVRGLFERSSSALSAGPVKIRTVTLLANASVIDARDIVLAETMTARYRYFAALIVI
jgi:hypothetical protein